MGGLSSRLNQPTSGFDAHGLKYPPSPNAQHHRKCRNHSRNIFKANGTNCKQNVKKSESIPTTKQEDWKTFESYPFENLVLSGGGSKGYAFVGALKALDDCGVLTRIRRVAGSSSGAVCAGLIAIGCTPQEIADVFSSDPRWIFQDQGCAPVYCVPNIWKKYGLHPGNRFYSIYGKAIAEQLGNPDITFEELYEQRGVELCIVVTNLNRMRAEYCHPTTTPTLPIRMAVRMSMSFPVIYQPVQYDLNHGVSWYTDGGMLDQYPIHCFDGTTLEMNHNSEKSKETIEEKFNARTLGLYVVSETPLDYQIWDTLFNMEIPYKPTYVPKTRLARERLKDNYPRKIRPTNRFRSIRDTQRWILRTSRHGRSSESIYHWPVQEQNVDIRSFSDFVATTIEALLVNQRKLKVKTNDVLRTIPINCGYVGTNDYDIESGDREFLVRQGYECSYAFLNDYINHDYESKVLALQHRNMLDKSIQTGESCTTSPRGSLSASAISGSLCGMAAGVHHPVLTSSLTSQQWRYRPTMHSTTTASRPSSVSTSNILTTAATVEQGTNTNHDACSCGTALTTLALRPPLAVSEASMLSAGSLSSSVSSIVSAGHLYSCQRCAGKTTTTGQQTTVAVGSCSPEVYSPLNESIETEV